jgi:DNA-binding NarL/FixJ family response regulator
MKVLWVENHPRFVSVVRQQFLAGHDVTVVPSLATARATLATGTYDVVLVDFDLDDGKGDALVREVRRQYPQLRVIATSSHEMGNRALVAAGADAACSKLEFGQIPELLGSPPARGLT